MSRGKFLVLEGIDGAGTTTHSRLLQDWLARRGIVAVVTREPSDGPIGSIIRNALSGRIRLSYGGGSKELTAETIALLFAADRLDHLASEIVPSLEKGAWVICDRYVDSSIAYQGSLMDRQWVATINRLAIPSDLTFFLDVDVDLAMSRITSSRTQQDMFETRDLLSRIAGEYRSWYYEQGERVSIIDSGLPMEEVHTHITQSLLRAFPDVLKG